MGKYDDIKYKLHYEKVPRHYSADFLARHNNRSSHYRIFRNRVVHVLDKIVKWVLYG